MNKNFKNILPPFIWSFLKSLKSEKYGWIGNYNTWDEASMKCTGYDSDIVIGKVREALLKVKNGEAVYERDSIIFDEIDYSWQLLSGLLLSSSKNNGNLNVLDFGGSLGSTYFQNKKILKELNTVVWNIVEQVKFVEIGKKEFQNNNLFFYETIEECYNKTKPNVILLGSVLQYIENPYGLLDKIMSFPFDFLIIDRTPFSLDNKAKIVVQNVPPIIYNASYPCHLFSKTEFKNYIKTNNLEIIEEYITEEENLKGLYLQGFIIKK